MKQHTRRSHHAVFRGTKFVVAAWIAGLVLLTASSAWANKVYKPCGKKWVKAASKLPQEQLQWMMQERSVEIVRDVDGDGREDRIVLSSGPSFRTCDVREDWHLKETSVRVELATGKTRLFHWINGQLVEGVKLYPQLGKMLVTGFDAAGNSFSKWVVLGRPAEAAPEPLLATTDLPELPDQP